MTAEILIKEMESLLDGPTKTYYTDWNIAVRRCIQLVQKHAQHPTPDTEQQSDEPSSARPENGQATESPDNSDGWREARLEARLKEKPSSEISETALQSAISTQPISETPEQPAEKWEEVHLRVCKDDQYKGPGERCISYKGVIYYPVRELSEDDKRYAVAGMGIMIRGVGACTKQGWLIDPLLAAQRAFEDLLRGFDIRRKSPEEKA